DAALRAQIATQVNSGLTNAEVLAQIATLRSLIIIETHDDLDRQAFEECVHCQRSILRGAVERRIVPPRCCNCRELRVCVILGIEVRQYGDKQPVLTLAMAS